MPIEAPPIKRLTSDYLLPPFKTELKNSHQVMIREVPDKPGFYHFSLDPNTCILDEYGNPRGCTFMATFPFEVRLELIANNDDMTLYELISEQELPARLRLVLIEGFAARSCPARLLTLDDDGYITQIVHLHPIDEEDQQDF